jgi:hypothetical protein
VRNIKQLADDLEKEVAYGSVKYIYDTDKEYEEFMNNLEPNRNYEMQAYEDESGIIHRRVVIDN